MYFLTVLRLIPSFLAISLWVNPFLFINNMSKTVSFFSNAPPRLHTEIKDHSIPFSLSNFTSEVAHFLTTLFGSTYHDREEWSLFLDTQATFLYSFRTKDLRITFCGGCQTRRALRRRTCFFRTSGSKKTGSYPVDQNNQFA